MEIKGIQEGKYAVFFYGGNKFTLGAISDEEIHETPWDHVNATWVSIGRGENGADIESFTISGTNKDDLTVSPVYRTVQDKHGD